MATDLLAAGLPLELLDRAIPSATNDEMLELAYQVLENLAGRAEAAADLAIDSDDRDVENEALVFTREVEALVHVWAKATRLRNAWHRVNDAKEDVEKAIRNRRARLDGKRTALEQFSHRRQRRAYTAWKVDRKRGQAQAAKTLKRANVTRERVMEALTRAAADGDVRVADVMVALDARLADTSVDGRQSVVAQVGKILRELAAEGQVVQIRPDGYDGGRRKPHRYALPEGDDAS